AAPLPPVTAPEPRELPEVAAPPEPDPAEPALRAAPAEPELALPATAVPPDEDADAPPPPATDPAAPFPAATWPAPALAAPFPAVVVSVPSADPADGPAATPCVSTACLKTLFVASNRACPSREPHAVSERASAAPRATSALGDGRRTPGPPVPLPLGSMPTPDPSTKLTESSLSPASTSMVRRPGRSGQEKPRIARFSLPRTTRGRSGTGVAPQRRRQA